MPHEMNDNEARWLAQFDSALENWTESAGNVTQIRARLERTLKRRRRLRLLLPVVAVTFAALLVGPLLWRVASELSTSLPLTVSLQGLSWRGVFEALAQVPLYAWAPVAGVLSWLVVGAVER